MLKISDLHVGLTADNNVKILKGIDLDVPSGEVHTIMGPNGGGKSTFANVLMGRPDYQITTGTIEFKGESILDLPPDARAHLGIFMAFQYPVEIPGVRPFQFLKAALDSRADATGQKKLSAREFAKLFDEKVAQVGINANLIKRSLNEGFSGGEKKRNEILQLEILQPVLAIMDETDSGLDVDALKIVAEGVNSQRSPDRSFLIVTHYQRLLNYIKPDRVHILVDGKIVETGGSELALKVEKSGYKKYLT